MGKSKIEWLRGPVSAKKPEPVAGHGYAFSAWWGCYKIGPGCDHCYAEAFDSRGLHGGTHWGVDAPLKYFGDDYWAQPLAWNALASKHGVRYDVFINNFADFFDNRADEKVRARAWALMKATPHLNWIIVTKRIGNAAKMLPEDWGNGYPNVWILITVVNQEEAARDIPKLLRIPAAVHGLSVEPMIEDIDITEHLWGRAEPCLYCPKDIDCDCGGTPRQQLDGERSLKWTICGDESGVGEKRSVPDSAVRSLRDQCANAGVAFFLKQRHVNGKKISLPELDGRQHMEWPA